MMAFIIRDAEAMQSYVSLRYDLMTISIVEKVDDALAFARKKDADCFAERYLPNMNYMVTQEEINE